MHPGKLGQEQVQYPHPDLKETLESTYGIIVYQEQVMRIANILGGYSLGEADVLRKAVGKKDAALIKKELGHFITRALERGVDRRSAEDLADQIETFGRYGFNRSHAAAYSLISYHTAWLKAYYPAEFMAAMLSAVLDKTDDVVKYIAECKDLARHLPDLEKGMLTVRTLPAAPSCGTAAHPPHKIYMIKTLKVHSIICFFQHLRSLHAAYSVHLGQRALPEPLRFREFLSHPTHGKRSQV